ncbi:MAG: PilZ domain-containing protein [Acidobacteriaceae bacterium]|nr:PilZ domain-containing protein [Acidobacteriaceae bacterium]
MHDDTHISTTGQVQAGDPAEAVRTSVRFPLKLPVRLQTAGGEVDATTENMSAKGVLVVSDLTLEINAGVDFTLAIPAAVLGTDADVTVHCVGHVIRHEQTDGDRKASAVMIDSYTFEA